MTTNHTHEHTMLKLKEDEWLKMKKEKVDRK